MHKILKYNLLLLTIFVSFLTFAQDASIPDAPNPPKLYNNFSKAFPNFLSPDEAAQLEKDLTTFANETSNQIVVVVVDDLNDLEPWDYATQLGVKWKVGHEKEDNGIVFLIKPTNDRKVFIAVGRGLEGVIPDYTAKNIITKEVTPRFKEGQYYLGISSAVGVMKSLAKGEFNSAKYAKKKTKKSNGVSPFMIFIIIIIVMSIISFIRRRRRGDDDFMGPGGFIFFGGGGFGGGGGDSGGSDFGGFGGGDFGGGGAGGDW